MARVASIIRLSVVCFAKSRRAANQKEQESTSLIDRLLSRTCIAESLSRRVGITSLLCP